VIYKIEDYNTLILGDGFLAHSLFREAGRNHLEDFKVFPLMHNWSQEQEFRKNLQVSTSLDQISNLKCVIFAMGPTNLKSLEFDTNDNSNIYVNIISQFIQRYAEISNSIRFIFLSSASVYGESISAKKEDDRLAPLSKYATGLIAAEEYLQFFSKQSHHSFIVLRLTSLYDNLLQSRVLGKIRFASNHNINLELFGRGQETRDFLHTSDLFRAIARILKVDHKYEIYNVGSGVNISIAEVVNICKGSNHNFSGLISFNGVHRAFEPRNMKVSINKLRKLDFLPLISPEYGLKRYFE
jgi:nucleoside-diphosphate-sugar epimerase